MVSSFPVRRIPSVLARGGQQRVSSVSRRFNSTSTTQFQNPSYPLYPSVTQLLHEKGIPQSEVSKIPASGPKGRLLKGDVLAYLGAIAANYPASQAARIGNLAHLDLSNIKIAETPKPVETKEAAAAAALEDAISALPPTTSIAVSVSLATVLSVQKKIQENLGVNVPLATFLARATDLANDDLPRSPHAQSSADELFDELLGAAPVHTSRGDYIPELNAVEPPHVPSSKPAQEDIIDFLSGKASKKTAIVDPLDFPAPGSATNVFSLTVPIGDEKRARAFLERVRDLLTIEPGRLVL